MTIPTDHLVIMFVGAVASVIAWFVRRDIARFEQIAEEQRKLLQQHSEAMHSVQSQIGRVIELGKWQPNLERFFGEGGGNSRLWKAIEILTHDVGQLRERDHFLINKLTVIKGRCDIVAKKYPDLGFNPTKDDWILPEWTSHKKEG